MNDLLYQGIRLPCKNDQGLRNPTIRTHATIGWFRKDTCATFQVAKFHARVIKHHKKILWNQNHSINYNLVGNDQIQIPIKK